MSYAIWSIYNPRWEQINEGLKSLNAGLAIDGERRGLDLRVVDDIAVVGIRGPMVKGVGAFGQMFGLADTNLINESVKRALADNQIKKLILDIDSPGGDVDGIVDLGDTIAAADKPVIAQVSGMAASAAYYIASQADEIYAGRADQVGSIGVYAMLYDTSEAMAAEAIKPIAITTGPYKGLGLPGTPITEDQQEEIKKLVDSYFNLFKTALRKGRGLTESTVKEVSDGRIWLAPEAKALGLIDKVQTIDATLTKQVKKYSTVARAKLNLRRRLVYG